MDTITFDPGDVVMLKSGGPKMTVQETLTEDAMYGGYECKKGDVACYFYNGDLGFERTTDGGTPAFVCWTFRPEMLVKVAVDA